MTRTTELLKEMKDIWDNLYKENSEYGKRNNWEEKNIIRATNNDAEEIIKYAKAKSELKGRLDALKEEVEFIKNFQTNCLCERCGRLDSLHRKRLASIREEIKLIEGKI